MVALQKHINVSTSTFVKNEARLMSEELAKSFTPKYEKSKRGIGIDRRIAYSVSRFGGTTIPWNRLQQAINRRRPSGPKPSVKPSVAMPSIRKGIASLGKFAAGFLGRGNKLGAKANGFVLAQTNKCYGDVTISMGIVSKWVRVRNFTPYLKNMQGAEYLVKRTIGKRASSMKTKARMIQRGVAEYWKK
jgi:hypothetical protein